MPSKNIVKEFAEDSYYHVYNRGVDGRQIFLDDQDYVVFLGLIKKYLMGENSNPRNRHKFDVLGDEVSILAYCLMPNHFHVLIYQKNVDGLTRFMRRLMTGYVMYFNNRYNRKGPLFQGTYKASHVNADDYLHHISRYIHLNPKDYKTWPYSSFNYYRGEKSSDWVNTDMILGLFDGDRNEYLEFVDQYEDSKRELDVLKHQLADD